MKKAPYLLLCQKTTKDWLDIWASMWEKVTSEMHSTKTYISLHILQVWSVFVVLMKTLVIMGNTKYAKWRFWLDCLTAPADLNLCWAHMIEGMISDVVGFVTMQDALTNTSRNLFASASDYGFLNF